MESDVIELVHYDLIRFEKHGGMGEIWAGIHREQGFPVAVKVLAPSFARRAWARRAFRTEVLAAARLSHPAVVAVLDLGDIPALAAEQSEGRLQPNLPFLVMEYVDGAHLRVPASNFDEFVAILESLLGALAHAHARGIVHRDLKPGNILQGADPADVRIIDFGLANLVEEGRSDTGSQLACTPGYAAPEQITSQRQLAEGPWTDLYALGCIAFELLNGGPPFRHPDVRELLRAHAEDPIPSARPAFPVPGEVNVWLARMLAKDPYHRYRRAADAWHDLQHIARQFDRMTVPPGNMEQKPSESASRPTTVIRGDALRDVLPKTPIHSLASEAFAGRATTMRSSRIPLTWRTDVSPASRVKEVAPRQSLALHRLRTAAMVGREPERDTLWEALRAVSSRNRPVCVLIDGPAGTGKSQLVRSMSERGHELGAATPMMAIHSPQPEASSGLSGMLARHLRCQGLKPDEVRARLRRWVAPREDISDYDLDALASVVMGGSPGIDDERPSVRFEMPTQWHRLVEQIVETEASERPVILWIDDAQWGLDALHLVKRLLGRRVHQPLPVLCVVCYEPDELTEVVSAQLERLRAHPQTRSLTLESMPIDTIRDAIDTIVPLPKGVSRKVANASSGIPLFMTQLLDSWLLQKTVPEATYLSPEVPNGMEELWEMRRDDVIRDAQLQGVPADTSAKALAVASALGTIVHLEEWADACRRLGFAPPQPVPESIVERALGRAARGGFAFSHFLFRNYLEEAAQREGLADLAHEACATMLRYRYPDPSSFVLERQGRHLLSAGLPDKAVEPLLRAAQHRWSRGERYESRELIALCERAVEDAGLPDTDVRVIRMYGIRAVMMRFEPNGMADAFILSDRTVDLSRALDPPDKRVLADSLRRRGSIAYAAGELNGARKYLHEALHLYDPKLDADGYGECLSDLGHMERRAGNLDPAEDFLRKAREHFKEHGGVRGAASATRGLADVAQARGQYARAHALFEDALDGLRRVGHEPRVAACLNGLADNARMRGRFKAARRYYEQSLDYYKSTGSPHARFVELNLGLTYVNEERYREAARLFWGVKDAAREARQGALALLTDTGLLPCVAAEEEWSELSALLEVAVARVSQTGIHEADVADCFRITGDICAKYGRRKLARKAYDAALDTWSRLERQDRIGDLMDRIEKLET